MGDSIVALPSFHAIRRHFCNDRLIMLSSKNAGILNAEDIFLSPGLVNEVITYNPKLGGIRRLLEMGRLLKEIRRRNIHELVYLPPSVRRTKQLRRDVLFFRLCGIKKFYCVDKFTELVLREPDGRSRRLQRESEWLLAQLEKEKIPTDRNFEKLAGYVVSQKEIDRVDAIFPKKTGVPSVAFCIGGKSTTQKWPLERYQELGKRLLAEYSLEPVLLGGKDDRETSDRLIREWGRGTNLCGACTFRETAEVLKRCVLYIGNDTGPMHLAALVGTPCVAVFSARNNPGVWEPWGDQHTVIRKEVSCAGCELQVCNVPGHPCMTRTQVEEVFDAAKKYLSGEKKGK